MSRTLLRTASRDDQRRFAKPNPTGGPNRKDRRKLGHRHGDVSALVHGPHDRAFLYSGTLNGGGQARINAKRQQRAEYWRTVRIPMSVEVEPYFRDSLHLLGDGARIDRRTPAAFFPFSLDLDVHIPGAPADAVKAEPVYRSEYSGDDTYAVTVDHIVWRRADGSAIPTLLTS